MIFLSIEIHKNIKWNVLYIFPHKLIRKVKFECSTKFFMISVKYQNKKRDQIMSSYYSTHLHLFTISNKMNLIK